MILYRLPLERHAKSHHHVLQPRMTASKVVQHADASRSEHSVVRHSQRTLLHQQVLLSWSPRPGTADLPAHLGAWAGCVGGEEAVGGRAEGGAVGSVAAVAPAWGGQGCHSHRDTNAASQRLLLEVGAPTATLSARAVWSGSCRTGRSCTGGVFSKHMLASVSLGHSLAAAGIHPTHQEMSIATSCEQRASSVMHRRDMPAARADPSPQHPTTCHTPCLKQGPSGQPPLCVPEDVVSCSHLDH